MRSFANIIRPETGCAFLSDLSCEQIGSPAEEGVLLQASYRREIFAPEFFDKWGIERPPCLANAVDKRLAEFLVGRLLARAGQAHLGRPPQQIMIGADRAPLWPDGLIGSISHTFDRCVCLMCPVGEIYPGIDIETVANAGRLEAIMAQVLTDREANLLEAEPNESITATLIFSAKETLYKALYPLVGRFFGFEAAEVVDLPGDSSLTLQLVMDLAIGLTKHQKFTIKYEVKGDRVTTVLLHRHAANTVF